MHVWTWQFKNLLGGWRFPVQTITHNINKQSFIIINIYYSVVATKWTLRNKVEYTPQNSEINWFRPMSGSETFQEWRSK